MKRKDSIDRAEFQPEFLALRHHFVLLVMLALLAGLVGRALYLQVVEHGFLASQGVQRQTVQTILSRDPRVLTFNDAPGDAGGWGATLVTLREAAS